MLDLSQRDRVELVGKQLTGSSIAEVLAHGSDEDVFGEEGVGEFFVDLFVGVEKPSGMDERLIALDIPEGSAGADHHTLLDLVQKVSDTEAVARGIGELIVLVLLVGCVASDEEVFIDLGCVNRCFLRRLRTQLTLSRISRLSFKNSKVP